VKLRRVNIKAEFKCVGLWPDVSNSRRAVTDVFYTLFLQVAVLTGCVALKFVRKILKFLTVALFSIIDL